MGVGVGGWREPIKKLTEGFLIPLFYLGNKVEYLQTKTETNYQL